MSDERQVRLFLSQAEGTSSRELERLLSAAFHGRVKCFNTAVAGHGMAAGDQLSPVLQEEIESCDLFASVWSPRSIENPAWMAWELGVALALGKQVKTYRVLGTSVADVPLGLGARFVPDLGLVEEFIAFCEDLDREFDIGLDVAEARSSFVPRDAPTSALWSQASPDDAIRLARRSDRLLVENVSRHVMEEIHVRPTSEVAIGVAAAINQALARHRRTMEPRQRIIVSPNELALSLGASDGEVIFEWMQLRSGRLHQIASVAIDDGTDR